MPVKKRTPARRKAAEPAPRPKPEPPAEPPAESPAGEPEEASVPRPPERGMTTEQIRRIGNRIAEHEQELKDSNTSRRN